MFALLFCMTPSQAADLPKVRVLLITGANNHNWKETTPAIMDALQQSGRFEVSVTDAPQDLSVAFLQNFDCLLSNFNTFTSRTMAPRDAHWTDSARKAYIDFVKSGKGHVVVHAGSASFYDWPEYQQLVLGTFKIGQTSHGRYHEFEVVLSEHPITRGLSDFKTTDELWHNTAFQEGVTVLAKAFSSKESGGSGKEETMAVAGSFGQGRSVFIVMGHDGRAIRNENFQALLTRGAEWAATGNVTIDATLAATLRPSPRPEESPAKTPPVLHWDRAADSLALLSGEQIVWRFNHGEKAGKPNFDPLAPVGRPSISWSSPPDHPWHYGLWFSWKLINGLNYWEIDRKTGKPSGSTRWKNVQSEPRADSSARISMDLEYSPGDETLPLLTEKRTIEISAPAADGSYSLDWTATFTGGTKDLLFDRTPPPAQKSGNASGGYAGLSMRMQKLSNVKTTSADGPIDINKEHRYRGTSLAFDYSGEPAGGTVVGVAMLDHPGNIHTPSPWYAICDAQMCYINPAVICFETFTLKATQSFTLRYRVIVHAGAWDAAKLVQLQKDFSQEKQTTKAKE